MKAQHCFSPNLPILLKLSKLDETVIQLSTLAKIFKVNLNYSLQVCAIKSANATLKYIFKKYID